MEGNGHNLSEYHRGIYMKWLEETWKIFVRVTSPWLRHWLGKEGLQYTSLVQNELG